jgi:hypothetical protein
MEQISFREAKGSSASQEIPQHFMKKKVHYRIYKSLLPDLILSQINQHISPILVPDDLF